MRAAKPAASAGLGSAVADAGDDHPAAAAYLQAKAWAQKTAVAAKAGDDETAKVYAQKAKDCAKATRALLKGKAAPEYPDATEPPAPDGADLAATPPGGGPAAFDSPEARAAAALAQASGNGTSATFLGGADGAQRVAWDGEGFSGAATVYPGKEDEGGHPRVRLALSDLDQDRYEALAASPWPYRTENGCVIYERLPADQAEQVLDAARTGRPGRPWERYGLERGGSRPKLATEEADRLKPESAEWHQKLDDNERTWVSNYTGADYSRINQHLYEGRSLDEQHEQDQVPMRQITAVLDSALAKAATPGRAHRTSCGYRPPLEVRKSNRTREWARETFQVGQVYRDDSYVSVSHCPRVAGGFATTAWEDEDGTTGYADHKVVFEVVSSRGAAVASASLFHNAERERLMPRGSTFRVVGVHEEAEVAGSRAVLVQLVDVHDIPRP